MKAGVPQRLLQKADGCQYCTFLHGTHTHTRDADNAVTGERTAWALGTAQAGLHDDRVTDEAGGGAYLGGVQEKLLEVL